MRATLQTETFRDSQLWNSAALLWNSAISYLRADQPCFFWNGSVQHGQSSSHSCLNIKKHDFIRTIFPFYQLIFLKTPYFSCFSVVHVMCSHEVMKNCCYTNSNFWRSFGWKEFFYNLNTLIHCLFGGLRLYDPFCWFFNFSTQRWAALIHRKSRLINSETALLFFVFSESGLNSAENRPTSETALFNARYLWDFNPS